MSKAFGKTRAGPGTRIPRLGNVANLQSRIPTVAAIRPIENGERNINIKNKKKRPRLNSNNFVSDLPAPPLRVKNDMPPPVPVTDQSDLKNRMVSGSTEFACRKKGFSNRSSIISSYHEKTFCSPDITADLQENHIKASTPTSAGSVDKTFDFPKTENNGTFKIPKNKEENNCTFEFSKNEEVIERRLSKNGTFDIDSLKSPATKHDGTFNLERKGSLPLTFTKTDQSYTIENKCNSTFDCISKTDLILSEKKCNETFSKLDKKPPSGEKPKRPSSWTDCGPRTFILGEICNYEKMMLGTPSNVYGSSKQSSIDQDESLGILTPGQMDSLLVTTPPIEQQSSELRFFLMQHQSQKKDGEDSPNQWSSMYNISRMSPPHIEGDDCESLLIVEDSNNPEECLANISQPSFMDTHLPFTPTSELNVKQYLQNLSPQLNAMDRTQCSDHNESTLKAQQLSQVLSEKDDSNLMQVSAHLFDDGGLMSVSGGSTSTVDMINSQDGEDQLVRRQALNLLLQKAHQNQQQQMISRADLTPSPPEELPLDPVDVKLDVESIADEPEENIASSAQHLPQEQMSLAESESKSQSTSGVSKTSNSFVASVTSITSLDNGYQGDGEMSRPVSRGAESHHLHNNGHNINNNNYHKNNIHNGDTAVIVIGRHLARADPMTDSDFFTESDADLASSEDNAHRLARVIDGRLLYGHTAANNNAGIPTAGPLCLVEDSSSCMESSGIYTDLENNSRTVTPPQGLMLKSASSSDSSAMSPNATAFKIPADEVMSMSVDESSEPVIVKSPNSSKKTKLSTKLNSPVGNATGKENKRPQAKRCNKWDSVMNKIAENKSARPSVHLREVKSKISTGLNSSSRSPRVRTLSKMPCTSVQSLNERTNTSQQMLKAKSRRTRVRASESNLLQDDSQSDASSSIAGNTVNSSPQSTTPAPGSTPTSGVSTRTLQRQGGSTPKKTSSPSAAIQSANRAAKKRDVVRQTSTPVVSDHLVRQAKQASPLRSVRPNNLLQKRGLSPGSNCTATGAVGNGSNGPPAEPKVPRKLISTKRMVTTAKSAPLKEHNRLPVSQTTVGAQANNNNNHKPSAPQQAATAPCSPPSPAPLPPVPSIPELCGPIAVFPAKCKNVVVAGKSNTITAREIAILHKSNRGLEALGILVQYLVYDLDAFACPSLKRSQRATGLSLMEARANCARLEQQLADEILRHARDVAEKDRMQLIVGEKTEERVRALESAIADITRERDIANEQILQLKKTHAEELENIRDEFSTERSESAGEIAFLRQTIEERSAEVAETRAKLNEQRIMLDDERDRYEKEKCMYEKELLKLEHSLTEAESATKGAEREADKWRTEAKTIRVELDNKIELLQHELNSLKSKNAEHEFNTPRTEANILKDEVESLRNVLELKQCELSELRKRNLELNRAADQLPAVQAKAHMLEARVEDLQVQLQRKMDDEKELHQRNKLLEESFHQEAKQKTRLSQYNEELQYRLKQNHEVVNVLAAMTGTTPEAALSPRKVVDYNVITNNNSFCNNQGDSNHTSSFIRSHSRNGSNGGRMSFNERYGSSDRASLKLERKHSFREKQDKHRSTISERPIGNGSSPCHASNTNNPRIYERHYSSPGHDSSGQSSDTSFESKPINKSQDCSFEMEDLSPPSSPQIKAVVEKSDSVSWVLEIAEPPEIVASRLVRRAGSFRNSTPPPKKNTNSPSHQSQPQTSPLLKRPRCNTGLTQRVIISNEVTRQNSDPTSTRPRSNSTTNNKLTRSASMGCAALNDSLMADWSNCGGSSTPYKSQNDSTNTHQNGTKEPQILITCDTTILTSRCDELCPTLPAHRILSDQRADTPDSSVSDISENSVDDCDKKSDENRMDGSWSEDGDTDI